MFEQLQEQAQEQETKIGMGKLLAIFAGLVVVCSFFFSLGYSLGKKSVSDTLIPEPTAHVSSATTPKPSPSQSLARGEPDVSSSSSAPNPSDAPVSSGSPAENSSKPAPEMRQGGAFVVQVAAVTRQEDAEALVNALRKKDYPVFIVNNAPGDKLFHVQIGPYTDQKDAEAMKARLAGDGYNPIVKK